MDGSVVGVGKKTVLYMPQCSVQVLCCTVQGPHWGNICETPLE